MRASLSMFDGQNLRKMGGAEELEAEVSPRKKQTPCSAREKESADRTSSR